MTSRIVQAVSAAALIAVTTPALAQTEIQWWHAFSGRLGELLQGQVEGFNASQDEFVVVATNKGNYGETMTAGIAAFRAGEQPHILQVYEVGTATMMSAEGAIYPVHQLMADTGTDFDPTAYLAAVTGYYTTPEGEMLSLPYNSVDARALRTTRTRSCAVPGSIRTWICRAPGNGGHRDGAGQAEGVTGRL